MTNGLVRVGWAVVMLALAAPAAAQEKAPAAPKPNIEFDHQKPQTKIYDLDLEDGQPFLVHILNTCPAEFDYTHVGVERGIVQQAVKAKPTDPLTTHPLSVVYDDQYGGYIFTIARKAGLTAGEKCVGSEELEGATFVVSIRKLEWRVGFSGGFTFSSLTSPVYAISTNNNVKTVIEEAGKQDSVRLGAASFVHVFHDRRPWIAPAFGLGINADNRAEYFVGVGIRLGDKATINVGGAFGSIARLPNGVNLGGVVTDDNVLNNMGSRVVGKAFFALSYSFIDTRENLKKPFAAAEAADVGKKDAGADKDKDKGKGAGPAASKVVETLVVVDDFAAAFPEFKGLKPCLVEVKADGDSWAATLSYAKPPKTDAAKVTAHLNEQMKKLDRKEVLKPDVAFAVCK